MRASIAHRLLQSQEALVMMAAPRLQRDTPVRPALAPVTAPLAQSLTLRELAALARLRNNLKGVN